MIQDTLCIVSLAFHRKVYSSLLYRLLPFIPMEAPSSLVDSIFLIRLYHD